MSIETVLDNCQYCAECCKWQDVLVEDEEINVISKKLAIEIEDFGTRQYLEGSLKTIHYRILKHKSDGHCIFLETNEKKYACSIYEFRPKFCAEYPSNDGQFEWCNEHKPIISK